MTFSKHFTASEFRTSLTNTVNRLGADQFAGEEGGSSCTYSNVVDGVLVPVCLIGQWVAQFGLLGLLAQAAPDLYTWNGSPVTRSAMENDGACTPGNEVWKSLALGGITLSDEAQQYARDAQEGQDSGLNWGSALAFADAMAVWRAGQEARINFGIATHESQPFIGDFRNSESTDD